MMIEVKGTRNSQTEADPAARYDFKDDEERKSKTPYLFSLFLLGIVLYLRSLFISEARQEETPRGDEDSKNALSEDAVAEGEAAEAPDRELTTGSVSNEPTSSAAGGRLLDFPISTKVGFVDFPDIGRFLPPEPPLVWSDSTKSPVKIQAPANDNQGDGDGGTLPGTGGSGDGDPDAGGPGGGNNGNEQPGNNGDDGSGGSDGNNPGGGNNGGEQPGNGNTDGSSPGGETPCTCQGGYPAGPGEEPDDDDDSGSGNRAPRVTGPVYLMDITGCAVLMIGLSDFLRNAYDPDGDALSVRNISTSSGTLVQSGGQWMFSADPSFIGDVTITYEITDGMAAIEQAAHFSVVRRGVMSGTDQDDIIVGSMCADDIDGGDGDDNIDARAGDDVISGGKGNDHIVAGEGRDVIFGGDGDDVVFGGDGDDHIWGGAGNDRLFGEAGNDIIFGDDGDDLLSGGEGEDILFGGAGNDILFGDTGDDILYGDDGDDVLHDGDGKDIVFGGEGNDQVVAALDQADDFYDGGAGHDTLDYSAASEQLVVDLAEGIASGIEIGTDTILGFEVVVGGSGDDVLSGSDGADTLFGGAGNDILHGGAGDDVLYGGDGDDILHGGDGDDVLHDGEGEDVVYGGDGDDRVVAALDQADDRYDGGAGYDTLDYSAATEQLVINLAEGIASGIEIGTDAILGFEAVIGGSGDDHFIVGDTPVTLSGGGGENVFEFLAPDTQAVATPEPLIYEILDFKVGDRIRMSKYDLFEKVFDRFEDEFEKIYGKGIDDDDVRIRYRHERVDEIERTIIEADFNRDHVYETTITLDGRHLLVVVENV